MLKQYLFITLLCLFAHINVIFSESGQPYVNKNSTVNQTLSKSNLTTTTVSALGNSKNSGDNNNSVQTEGGSVNLINAKSHIGRENVVDKSVTVNEISTEKPEVKSGTVTGKLVENTPTPAENNKINETPQPSIEYFGDSRVKPRKGVNFTATAPTLIPAAPPLVRTPVSPAKTPGPSKKTPDSDQASNSGVKSPNSAKTPDSNVLSSVSPNKLNTTTSATEKTTPKPSTTTFIPRKPTVTFGSDDESPLNRFAAPKVALDKQEVFPKNTSGSAKILSSADGERVITNREFSKGPDYVLPIVLTILAVPLLAIILTVVYKRGSEWWYHRHYRRMDFLIDGMYNN